MEKETTGWTNKPVVIKKPGRVTSVQVVNIQFLAKMPLVQMIITNDQLYGPQFELHKNLSENDRD